MTEKPHHILFVTLDGVQSLDLFGPLEVFATTKSISECAYDWKIGAFSDTPITTESGSRLLPDVVLSTGLSVDTLVIAGGCGPRTAELSEEKFRVLGTLAEKARRVVSICTGAFLLDRLGLTSGRTIATHWQFTDCLSQANDQHMVDPNSLYVKDGKLWTSAGVTAGIDLALAIVAEDYGESLAASVAQYLVVYMHRTGGQAQFSAALKAQTGEAGKIGPILNWIVDNLSRQITVPDLAAQACMSIRQFSRVFTKQTGIPPAKYIENLRMDHARSLLSEGKSRIDEVAKSVGYASSDSFRRAFIRRFAVCPTLYQMQFSSSHKK